MLKPVSLDFETNMLEYYHPDFSVVSCAFTYKDDKGDFDRVYIEGQGEVGEYLEGLAKEDRSIIVHNLQFELGVILSQYPLLNISLERYWDTKRLIQVTDNGRVLDKKAPKYMQQGLSLQACTSRHLPTKYHNHKEPFYEWIRNNLSVKKGEEGEHLSKLPKELLKEYNTLDTDITYLLYEKALRGFKQDGYQGYEMDHVLYRFRCLQLVKARIDGIKVDLKGLSKAKQTFTLQLEDIERRFYEAVGSEIEQVKQQKRDLFLTAPLSADRHYKNRLDKVESGERVFEFKITSAKDLYWLYNGVMGIEPPFYTRPDKDGKGGGSPSFKKGHLSLWHESGKILEDKGTIGIAKKQSESLYLLSEFDGRYHIDMNSTGTVTSRLSGRDGSE